MIDWSKVKTPKDIQDELDAKHNREIEQSLMLIDLKSVRAIRGGSAEDKAVLEKLEAEAIALRAQLRRGKEAPLP